MCAKYGNLRGYHRINARLYSYCVIPENIYTLPTEGHWKLLRGGGGVLKAKVLEGKFEAKLEFPGEWGWGGEGCKTRTFRGGSMDIFWNSALLANINLILC